MRSLDGKVVVITGAGSGIGRALALNLAARGARLALSDVDEAGLAETERLVTTGTPAEVHTARLDVADRDAMAAYATEDADRETGQPDPDSDGTQTAVADTTPGGAR